MKIALLALTGFAFTAVATTEWSSMNGAGGTNALWNKSTTTTAEKPSEKPAETTPAAGLEEKLSAVGATKKDEEGNLQLDLQSEFLFDPGKATLKPGAIENIRKVASALMDTNGKVTVEGHADSTGNAKRNQKLSELRAKAVRDALENEGLPESRLSAVGRGSDEPIAGNDTPADRAKNRRVELHIENR